MSTPRDPERFVASLTPEAARVLTDEVKADAQALWAKLLTLYDGGAHLALGHTSWAAYCAAEFAWSDATAYRLLQSARVVDQLPIGSPVPVAEGVARELVPLKDNPAALQGAWTEAVERADNGRPTAAQVREVVAAHTPAVAPEKPPIMGTVKSQRQLAQGIVSRVRMMGHLEVEIDAGAMCNAPADESEREAWLGELRTAQRILRLTIKALSSDA